MHDKSLLGWMLVLLLLTGAREARAQCTTSDTPLRPIVATHTIPPYPEMSVMTKEQGKTLLDVSIGADGVPTDVQVAQTSGSLRLDEAARDYVKATWRWSPPVKDCKPVAVKTRVSILWDLHDAQGRLMVISRTALLQYSKAGQDISRQTQAYIDTAKQELGAQAAELEKKGTSLQEELPTLSQTERDRRLQVFKNEEEALRASARQRDAQIRNGVETARHVMEQAFGPVVAKMMKDHRVDLVLDKNATSAGFPGLDVTGEAIEKLDAALDSVPVTLTDKPASEQSN